MPEDRFIFHHFYLSVFSHKAKGTSDLLQPAHVLMRHSEGPGLSQQPSAKTAKLRSQATSSPRLQHLPFQAHTDLLKNFQGHADIVKLLPAFVDILQARHHEIPVGKKNGSGSADFRVAALPLTVGARAEIPRHGERALRHHPGPGR